MEERVRSFEEYSAILEPIANRYTAGSDEHTALEHAAIALWYVLAKDHDGFKECVTHWDGDLTPEQRAHLIATGIDPDADPEDPDSNLQ